MSTAQRNLLPLDEVPVETEAAAPFALKEQVAQRLAAHRARRTQVQGNSVTPIADRTPANSRASRIAAAVAERYANSQSYRAFLAAQAEAAIHEAEAAAEVAALNAQAVADAQYQLLAELDQLAVTPSVPVPATEVAATAKVESSEGSASKGAQSPDSGLTVWLYDADQATPNLARASTTTNWSRPSAAPDEAEAMALDEEIAFRQSPTFEDALGADRHSRQPDRVSPPACRAAQGSTAARRRSSAGRG